jgi:hypothetical protein
MHVLAPRWHDILSHRCDSAAARDKTCVRKGLLCFFFNQNSGSAWTFKKTVGAAAHAIVMRLYRMTAFAAGLNP